jgi:GSH-dependent disulfide-bond oxidoreductase
MYDLYFWPTPNGRKIVILLEELGLSYRICPVNLGTGAQHEPEFLAISPNNRIPALVDHEPEAGEGAFSVFESGAIMIYLAEKHRRFLPEAPRARSTVLQWVMWQMANQGPKFGENSHFRRAAQIEANGDLGYSVTRFADEVNRLHRVMERRLATSEWLAGDEYSIADMISYPWTTLWEFSGVDIARYPAVSAWMNRIAARPAVARAMQIGNELRSA